jgi:D-alanyl-D-alanine carboxypeptidase/D-alanyl-D-alanine-endopeptidase (penicillin-binding protein 4)
MPTRASAASLAVLALVLALPLAAPPAQASRTQKAGAPRPGPAASAPAAPAASTLPPVVARALRASGLPLASFGIDARPVDDAAAGDVLALNAEQRFLLASTTKLVTSLAALDLLGPDHRWTTTAHATGPVVEGRLSGDLVIVGGEVGLTAGELRRWFTQMRGEGLTEVAGRIVLDDVSLLHERDPAQAASTAREALPDTVDGAKLDSEAKAYNVGKLLVSVEPTKSERALVGVRPRPANVVVVNEVFMGGGCSAWARWKSPEETKGGPPLQLWVRGRWDADCGHGDIAWVRPPQPLNYAPTLAGAAVPEPVPAPALVAEIWRETGGRLRGGVIENDAAPAPKRGAWSSTVATPLAEVMREMNKTSNNAAAKSVLRALGGNPAAVRRGSLDSAHARVTDWLRGQGLADGDISIEEGAGQSRAERGKPRALVKLLVNAWRAAGSQAFVDSLPIAGVDGTLVHRMKGGAASGVAFLKTGTLSDTRALAGYVRGKSGKVYAVTAIVTHPDAAKGTPALDAVIEWLAREG